MKAAGGGSHSGEPWQAVRSEAVPVQIEATHPNSRGIPMLLSWSCKVAIEYLLSMKRSIRLTSLLDQILDYTNKYTNA
jgi:hypothetical protein